MFQGWCSFGFCVCIDTIKEKAGKKGKKTKEKNNPGVPAEIDEVCLIIFM